MSDSSDSNFESWIQFAFGCFLGFILSTIIWKFVIFSERQEAIDAGVGRYVVDPKTGSTNFEYGLPKKE